jgi:DNA-binding MarR family transcriptional regulator
MKSKPPQDEIEKMKRLAKKYPNEYFKKGRRIYLPSILSLILSQYYSLSAEDFLENNVIIPTPMLNKSKNYLLAMLVAFIIDEGTIDSGQILIRLQNKKLINQLLEICHKLDYKSNITYSKKEYCLYILSDGVKKFWSDYMSLKKEYPEVFMGYKEDKIKDFILRKEKILRSKGQNSTKNVIIKLLKEKPRKISELSKLLLISRQGIKFHIKSLEKKNIVKRKTIARGKLGGDTYKLIKFVRFSEKRKGLSRQEGVTKDNILALLKNEKLSAKDLAKKLKIDSNTMRTFLYTIEKEGLIERAGKQKVDAHHYKLLWHTK